MEHGQGCGPRDVAYLRKILTDIVENKSPEKSAGIIVSKHVTESTQRLVNKLRDRGRKHIRQTTTMVWVLAILKESVLD